MRWDRAKLKWIFVLECKKNLWNIKVDICLDLGRDWGWSWRFKTHGLADGTWHHKGREDGVNGEEGQCVTMGTARRRGGGQLGSMREYGQRGRTSGNYGVSEEQWRRQSAVIPSDRKRCRRPGKVKTKNRVGFSNWKIVAVLTRAVSRVVEAVNWRMFWGWKKKVDSEDRTHLWEVWS